MLEKQSILVTGGTGSFGRAFVKYALSHFNPRRLIVYSRDELKQFEMQQEIPHPALRFFLGDVRDKERLELAFNEVDIVVHAAALKQIPAAEYNPMECIKTNVMGSHNIIQVALQQNVKKVIALSTDKAANPANLYGATKLAADKLFIAANRLVGSRETRFAVVRYGNVIGSRGSVIALFQKMLREGAEELPVTDPRMTRFWITLKQGVQFVIKALQRMHGGEIFIPKLPSAGILDILYSLSSDVRLKKIGIREGEKLHELLFTKDDARHVLDFLDHYVIKPSNSLEAFCSQYEKNALGEWGKPIEEQFEYSSETNSWFLTKEEIRELLDAQIHPLCEAVS